RLGAAPPRRLSSWAGSWATPAGLGPASPNWRPIMRDRLLLGASPAMGLAFLGLAGLVAIPSPPRSASGQQPSAPTDDPTVSLPSRIFLSCSASDDPMKGIVAIDPNTGIWSRVDEDSSVSARVSLDGKRIALPKRAEVAPWDRLAVTGLPSEHGS